MNDEGDVAGTEPITTDDAPEWMGSLGDDMKGDSSLAKFKDVSGLAKSYRELETKMSTSVNIPGDGATDEEFGEFYGKMGRPESPNNYQFELPEGLERDTAREEIFKPIFHSIGLNQKQVSALVGAENQRILKENENFRTTRELNELELKKEWGDDFENNMALIDKTINALGDDEVKKVYGDKNVLYNKSITKMLFEVSKNMGEDSFVKGEASAGEGEIETAKARIKQIYSDDKYLNGTIAEKQALSQEMRRLNLIIHGSGKVLEHGAAQTG